MGDPADRKKNSTNEPKKPWISSSQHWSPVTVKSSPATSEQWRSQDLVAQRVFSIACGYPDGNDSARLGSDPMHKLYDRPCRLVFRPADRPSIPPPIYSADWQPSAVVRRHRNCLLADQIGQRQACKKFLGTTNTLLCYRQTRRSLRKCLKQRLVNMFVAREASFVFKFTNNAG